MQLINFQLRNSHKLNINQQMNVPLSMIKEVSKLKFLEAHQIGD